MSAYTPGPWRAVDVASNAFNVRAGEDSIAAVYKMIGSPVLMNRADEGPANARLIAQAPAMAEALRALLGLAEEAIALREASDDDDDHEMLDVYRADVARARAILSTIEGA